LPQTLPPHERHPMAGPRKSVCHARNRADRCCPCGLWADEVFAVDGRSRLCHLFVGLHPRRRSLSRARRLLRSSGFVSGWCRNRTVPFFVRVERYCCEIQRKEIKMRFMVLVKADRNSEAGVMPSEKLLAEMGKFNEELVKAGV